ncbi:MAG: MSHA biogenesis protein MshJ [Methylotenera sp.]|nr:MSHA biogenesis protein MshJ [Methylotenera sp.]
MNAAFGNLWQMLTTKFEALNTRERWMVLAALLAVTYAVMNLLFIAPQDAQQKKMLSETANDQALLADLQQQIQLYDHRANLDPDAANKQRIAELQSDLLALDNALEQAQASLIQPEKMPELLRSLLQRNGKLKLVALKTLAVENIVPSPPASELAEKNPVAAEFSGYKHGVELTIEGRYLDLMDYVAALEKTPWHLLWSKAELSAKYPVNQLKLTVYTLSLDKAWLSI